MKSEARVQSASFLLAVLIPIATSIALRLFVDARPQRGLSSITVPIL